MKTNEFDNIGRRLPYSESPEYISDLVGKCADEAVRGSRSKRHYGLMHSLGGNAWAVAASVVLIFAAALTFIIHGYRAPADIYMDAIAQAPSFDDVMASLTEPQIESLGYEFVDMPEYDAYYE